MLVLWRLLILIKICAGQVIPSKQAANDGDYNLVNTDGSFDFGYSNDDVGSSYHVAHANSENVVGGRFGGRDPKTGLVKETVYTAGPRGFRARGPDISRKMDLDQRPRPNIGTKEDPYFDPYEDPSYSFGLRTSTYTKQEDADSNGDVKGHYSYIDDVGERHNVDYIAGKDTGFHVQSAYPDSNTAAIGPLYYQGPLKRGETQPRGHSSIQRGLDGSYKFISAGPDQRRSESSDANGFVRGSYAFLDDKGVQRTVHYVAGPGIGYRVVKSSKDPYFAQYFSHLSDLQDPEILKSVSSEAGVGFSNEGATNDLIFDKPGGVAATGHVKPLKGGGIYGGYGNSKGYAGNRNPGRYNYDSPSTRRPAYNGGDRKPYTPNVLPANSGSSEYDKGSRGSDERSSERRGPNEGDSNAYIPPSSNHPYDEGSGYSRGSNEDNYNYSGQKKNGVGRGSVKFNGNNEKGTVVNNVGDDTLTFPPGVSVRAHVQSIDLYPAGSRALSPGEAIEQHIDKEHKQDYK